MAAHEPVVDASALVEFLRTSELGRRVHRRISGRKLHLPHVCGVEVAHALRGLERAGKLPERTGREALAAFTVLRTDRYPVEPFLARIWELRPNLTAYDATYVVLAEQLHAPLVTVDSKFDTPVVRRLIELDVIS